MSDKERRRVNNAFCLILNFVTIWILAAVAFLDALAASAW